MTTAKQLSTAELEDGLDHIFESPKDEGRLELIVRRPDVDQREVIEQGRLDVEQGLVGDAIVEVTEPPHTGCKKFAQRFGKDAVLFVNAGQGKKLNFRGICAKVVQSGDINTGDIARKAGP